jgi:hypothetical protein
MLQENGAAAIFVVASHRSTRSDYPMSVHLILTFLIIHLHHHLFSSLTTSKPTSNSPISIFHHRLKKLSNLFISRIVVTNILPQTHLMEHNEVEPQQSTASAATSNASHTSVSASTSTDADVVDSPVHPNLFRSKGTV